MIPLSDYDGVTGQPLRILLLGPPEVLWCRQAVEIPRRQTRALLFRLAARMEAVSREHLCFLFWPDAPDPAARRHLTHLLTHLRLALPLPQAVLVHADFVALDRALIWVDLNYLHSLCSGDQARLDSEDCWKVLDLVRGSFLDGFSLPHCPEYELWAAQEQQHWDCQILRLLAKLNCPGKPMAPFHDELVSLQADNHQVVAQVERRLVRDLLGQLRLVRGETASGGM